MEFVNLCNKCFIFDFMFMICIFILLILMWYNMEDLLLGCRFLVKKVDLYIVNFL